MRWLWVVTGVLLLAIGIVWALQGLNVLGGSVMSGRTIFAVIGPIVALVGLALAAYGALRRRAPTM